jgi:DNA-binding NarL/FixJ family response regulator
VSTRVIVADDQAIARQGLRMILESDPDIEVVGEAIDGLDGSVRCSAGRPTSC